MGASFSIDDSNKARWIVGEKFVLQQNATMIKGLMGSWRLEDNDPMTEIPKIKKYNQDLVVYRSVHGDGCPYAEYRYKSGIISYGPLVNRCGEPLWIRKGTVVEVTEVVEIWSIDAGTSYGIYGVIDYPIEKSKSVKKIEFRFSGSFFINRSKKSTTSSEDPILENPEWLLREGGLKSFQNNKNIDDSVFNG